MTAIAEPAPQIPARVHIAMAHYQFEAIHPFLDGNGRGGRLLVALLLVERGLLPGPVLSLSDVLENYRREYVDALTGVSIDGDWERWIVFFLDSVARQATKDHQRFESLSRLREQWRSRYQAGRSVARLRFADVVFETSVFSAPQAARRLDLPMGTVQRAIDQVMKHGSLREITGQRRNRVYASDEVLTIVSPAYDRRWMVTDEHDVRRIATALPGVAEDGDSGAFQIDGQKFAWPWRERVHPKKTKVERRDVLVVPVEDEDEKLALCEAEPDIFFTEPHYDGYAMVLVRLAAIDEARLAELLADAREIVIEKTAKKRKRQRPGSRTQQA